MSRNTKIHGRIMIPCSFDLESYSKRVKESEGSVESDFLHNYNETLFIGEMISESAKIYIVNNWGKVKDWKDLEVIISDNSGTPTEYYNFKEEKGWTAHGKFLKDAFDDANKKRHNPVKELKEIVLDPTDGDFSLTINGKDHLWIDDESVIIIADYIEGKLKKLKKK